MNLHIAQCAIAVIGVVYVEKRTKSGNGAVFVHSLDGGDTIAKGVTGHSAIGGGSGKFSEGNIKRNRVTSRGIVISTGTGASVYGVGICSRGESEILVTLIL